MKPTAILMALTALFLAACGGGGSDPVVEDPIPQFPTNGVVPVTSMAGVECG